ncbi:MAG TPA: hypothetical protein VKX45_06900 [Bryobacteraceae bacterium]|jgi:hypothetical protein|nr:hypothetical protein [Bryobacteraceae bacterium]
MLIPALGRASVFYSANGAGSLLTYDTVGNLLFTTPLTGFSGMIESLAVQPGTGTLFGEAAVGSTSDDLITIDPNTGAVTTIGTMFSRGSGSGQVFETTNLAFLDSGNLYLGVNDSLYQVNSLNASISLVGGAGIDGPLAGGAGLTLWASNTTNVYSVAPATGALTLLGNTVLSPSGRSLTAGPGGNLYFIRAGVSNYTLNDLDSNYNETQGATLAGPPVPGALTYDSQNFSPEPAAFGLLGAGIAGLFVFRKYLR